MDAAAPVIQAIDFKIEIVPTDGTKAANLRKRGLRYVAVFGQPSAKATLLSCAKTLHCFQFDVECLNRGRGSHSCRSRANKRLMHRNKCRRGPLPCAREFDVAFYPSCHRDVPNSRLLPSAAIVPSVGGSLLIIHILSVEARIAAPLEDLL